MLGSGTVEEQGRWSRQVAPMVTTGGSAEHP